jgi:cytochrome c556
VLRDAQTTTTVPTQPATTSGGAGAVPSFASAKNCQDMAGIAAKVASALESSSGNGAKTLQTEESELQALANAAPPAIKSDFQTFATTFQSFRGAIQKSGYNLGSKTPPTPAQAAALAKAAKSFDGTKLKQAEQHLSAWARQNCHGVHVGG